MTGYSHGYSVGDTRDEFICPKCSSRWWTKENGRFCGRYGNDVTTNPTVKRTVVLVEKPNPVPRSWWMIGYSAVVRSWEEVL